MKKLLLFGLGVIASLSVLTSCKKDVVVASPTITFFNGVNQYDAKEADTAYTFQADVVAEGEISSIKIFEVDVNGKETQISSITKFDSDTKHEVKYTVKLADVTDFKKFKIMVTDKKDMSIFQSFLINAYVKPASILNSYTAVLVGGNTNFSGAYGCFYSSSNNLAYNLTDAKTNSGLVDFIYGYGPTYLAHLAAPSDKVMVSGLAANLTTKNTTIIGKTSLTPSQFDAITKESELPSLASLGTETYAKLLAVGDVVAFQTNSKKIGLVKILEINMGTTGADDVAKYANGTMKIQVKVQK